MQSLPLKDEALSRKAAQTSVVALVYTVVFAHMFWCCLREFVFACERHPESRRAVSLARNGNERLQLGVSEEIFP